MWQCIRRYACRARTTSCAHSCTMRRDRSTNRSGPKGCNYWYEGGSVSSMTKRGREGEEGHVRCGDAA